MKDYEVLEKLHEIYLTYFNRNFLTQGLYSDDKKTMDEAVKEVQDQCPHEFSKNNESAIEDGYCSICGKKIDN